MNSLSLTNLLVLCQVVEKGSVSEAAKELYLTQPAITHHLRVVEKYFGAKLFVKKGNRLITNQSGIKVYEQSKSIMERLTLLKNEVDLTGKPIRIGCGINSGSYIFPALLKQCPMQLGKEKIAILSNYAEQIFNALLAGTLDLGITVNYNVPNDLVIRTVFRDRIVLVASPGHPLADTKDILPSQLIIFPLIIPPVKTSLIRQMFDAEILKKNLILSSYVECRQREVAKRMVMQGENYVALLTYASVYQELKGNLLKELNCPELDLKMEYGLIHQPVIGNEVAKLANILCQKLEKYPQGILI